MPTEFNIIKKYFNQKTKQTDLGIGDDAALIRVEKGYHLAISSDMLVAGTHFYHGDKPYDIGWKSMAVNLSDMAAMGATPKWATLSIALPDANETWLGEFARGFFACADTFDVDLIGGDTTRGSLNISVTIMGEVAIGKALRRDNAKTGDDIWVSGTLGDAALGLAHVQNKLHDKIILDDGYIEYCLNALHRPQPRILLGLALLNLVHSAIDISDGLLSDLGHILQASKMGAEIQLDKLPCSPFTYKHFGEKQIQQCVLAGGDDYELCFTAPQKNRSTIEKVGEKLHLPITLIGNIHADSGLTVLDKNKQKISLEKSGYDHFA